MARNKRLVPVLALSLVLLAGCPGCLSALVVEKASAKARSDPTSAEATWPLGGLYALLPLTVAADVALIPVYWVALLITAPSSALGGWMAFH